MLHLEKIPLRNAQFVTESKGFDLEMKVSKMKTEVGRRHSLTTTNSKPWWKRIRDKPWESQHSISALTAALLVVT
ncbi:unnamed protein product [Heligmosomoides polygyrus]|uniref:Ovule protein n=1 Tax=Heligmosomoides polygyrus TaxID=6339 RepID=A0A183F597_HELPZ|nr:unnamed protein product [Heligmosomoides polygyrus]